MKKDIINNQSEIDLQNGADAYNAGDYETAVKLYQRSADTGRLNDQISAYFWRMQLGKALSKKNISKSTGKKILLHIGKFQRPEEKEIWAKKAASVVMEKTSETEIMKELHIN